MAPNAWDGLENILPADVVYALSNNRPLRTGTLQSARALHGRSEPLASAVEQRITDIDLTIAALNDERTRLSTKDYTRRAMDAVCAVLCAPIRRVPADIIREIALYAMDDFPSPARNRAPVNLAQVSSTWRSIILDSPQFWTTLYLKVRTANLDMLMRRLNLANTWFQRAGSLPINLFLYVDCKIGSGNNTAYNFNLFLKALGQWAPRVKRLGLGGRHWANLMLNSVDVEWDLCGLEMLDILGQPTLPTGEELASFNKITLFQSAKRLTSVVASQDMSPSLNSLQFIPWHQITSLSLLEEYQTPPDLKSVFDNCPKLLSASFFRDSLEPSDFLELAPCNVGHLEKLYLEAYVCDIRAWPLLFNRMSFPQLTHLFIKVSQDTLTSLDVSEDIPICPLPNLVHLAITGNAQIPTEFLLRLLHKTPRLRTFIMDFHGKYGFENPDLNKICKAMTIDDSPDDFLPMLEECTFCRYKGGSLYLLDASIISRFIHSRSRDIGINLKKVAFMGPFGFMSDLLKDVARLSAGAELSAEIILHPSPTKDYSGLHLTNLKMSPFAPDSNYRGHMYEVDYHASFSSRFD